MQKEISVLTDTEHEVSLHLSDKGLHFELFVPFGTKKLTVTPAAHLQDSYMLFEPKTQTV